MTWLVIKTGCPYCAYDWIAVVQVGTRAWGWTWQGLSAPLEVADNVLTLGLVIVLVGWWMRVRHARG